MADVVLFNSDDVRILQELIKREKKQLRSRPVVRVPIDDESQQSPEVYIALTPTDGIPALTADLNYGTSTGSGTGTDYGVAGNTPGYATCAIYQIVYRNSIPDLWPVEGLSLRVHNLSRTIVPGGTFVPIWRDKFGSWLALPHCCSPSSVPAEYIATTETTAGNVNTISLDLPTGVQVGDRLVAAIFVQEIGGTLATMTPVDAWTTIEEGTNLNFLQNFRWWIGELEVTESTPSTLVFNLSTNNGMTGSVSALRNVLASSDSATDVDGGSGETTQDYPSVTFNGDGGILFRVLFHYPENAPADPPTGMTAVEFLSDPADWIEGFYQESMPAGASGAGSTTTISGRFWNSVSVAFDRG